MNGLVELGHDVYAVTTRTSLKWYVDAYKDIIYKPVEPEIVKKSPLYVRIRRRIKKIALDLLQKNNASSHEKPLFALRSLISGFTESLIKNYHSLGIVSDIFIASHTFTGDAVYILGKNKPKVMYNMHFEELMFEDEIDRAQLRMFSNLPFNHVSLSTWLYKMFKYNYGIESKIITPGIDTSIFSCVLDKDKFIKAETYKIITYCDPTRKFKGFNQQMEILSKISKKHNVEILVYGHDPKTELFPYRFLGWVTQSELAEYYKQSHILLMPSWFESFPLPPIEAMACGCSVVALKYGTEDYLEDGVTGLVINPFEVEECIKKLELFLNDPNMMYSCAYNGINKSKDFNWKEQVEVFNRHITSLPETHSVDITKIQAGELDEFNCIYGS